jgi:hypothetical protein
LDLVEHDIGPAIGVQPCLDVRVQTLEILDIVIFKGFKVHPYDRLCRYAVVQQVLLVQIQQRRLAAAPYTGDDFD